MIKNTRSSDKSETVERKDFSVTTDYKVDHSYQVPEWNAERYGEYVGFESISTKVFYGSGLKKDKARAHLPFMVYTLHRLAAWGLINPIWPKTNSELVMTLSETFDNTKRLQYFTETYGFQTEWINVVKLPQEDQDEGLAELELSLSLRCPFFVLWTTLMPQYPLMFKWTKSISNFTEAFAPYEFCQDTMFDENDDTPIFLQEKIAFVMATFRAYPRLLPQGSYWGCPLVFYQGCDDVLSVEDKLSNDGIDILRTPLRYDTASCHSGYDLLVRWLPNAIQGRLPIEFIFSQAKYAIGWYALRYSSIMNSRSSRSTAWPLLNKYDDPAMAKSRAPNEFCDPSQILRFQQIVFGGVEHSFSMDTARSDMSANETPHDQLSSHPDLTKNDKFFIQAYSRDDYYAIHCGWGGYFTQKIIAALSPTQQKMLDEAIAIRKANTPKSTIPTLVSTFKFTDEYKTAFSQVGLTFNGTVARSTSQALARRLIQINERLKLQEADDSDTESNGGSIEVEIPADGVISNSQPQEDPALGKRELLDEPDTETVRDAQRVQGSAKASPAKTVSDRSASVKPPTVKSLHDQTKITMDLELLQAPTSNIDVSQVEEVDVKPRIDKTLMTPTKNSDEPKTKPKRPYKKKPVESSDSSDSFIDMGSEVVFSDEDEEAAYHKARLTQLARKPMPPQADINRAEKRKANKKVVDEAVDKPSKPVKPSKKTKDAIAGFASDLIKTVLPDPILPLSCLVPVTTNTSITMTEENLPKTLPTTSGPMVQEALPQATTSIVNNKLVTTAPPGWVPQKKIKDEQPVVRLEHTPAQKPVPLFPVKPKQQILAFSGVSKPLAVPAEQPAGLVNSEQMMQMIQEQKRRPGRPPNTPEQNALSQALRQQQEKQRYLANVAMLKSRPSTIVDPQAVRGPSPFALAIGTQPRAGQIFSLDASTALYMMDNPLMVDAEELTEEEIKARERTLGYQRPALDGNNVYQSVGDLHQSVFGSRDGEIQRLKPYQVLSEDRTKIVIDQNLLESYRNVYDPQEAERIKYDEVAFAGSIKEPINTYFENRLFAAAKKLSVCVPPADQQFYFSGFSFNDLAKSIQDDCKTQHEFSDLNLQIRRDLEQDLAELELELTHNPTSPSMVAGSLQGFLSDKIIHSSIPRQTDIDHAAGLLSSTNIISQHIKQNQSRSKHAVVNSHVMQAATALEIKIHNEQILLLSQKGKSIEAYGSDIPLKKLHQSLLMDLLYRIEHDYHMRENRNATEHMKRVQNMSDACLCDTRFCVGPKYTVHADPARSDVTETSLVMQLNTRQHEALITKAMKSFADTKSDYNSAVGLTLIFPLTNPEFWSKVTYNHSDFDRNVRGDQSYATHSQIHYASKYMWDTIPETVHHAIRQVPRFIDWLISPRGFKSYCVRETTMQTETGQRVTSKTTAGTRGSLSWPVFSFQDAFLWSIEGLTRCGSDNGLWNISRAHVHLVWRPPLTIRNDRFTEILSCLVQIFGKLITVRNIRTSNQINYILKERLFIATTLCIEPRLETRPDTQFTQRLKCNGHYPTLPELPEGQSWLVSPTTSMNTFYQAEENNIGMFFSDTKFLCSHLQTGADVSPTKSFLTLFENQSLKVNHCTFCAVRLDVEKVMDFFDILGWQWKIVTRHEFAQSDLWKKSIYSSMSKTDREIRMKLDFYASCCVPLMFQRRLRHSHLWHCTVLARAFQSIAPDAGADEIEHMMALYLAWCKRFRQTFKCIYATQIPGQPISVQKGTIFKDLVFYLANLIGRGSENASSKTFLFFGGAGASGKTTICQRLQSFFGYGTDSVKPTSGDKPGRYANVETNPCYFVDEINCTMTVQRRNDFGESMSQGANALYYFAKYEASPSTIYKLDSTAKIFNIYLFASARFSGFPSREQFEYDCEISSRLMQQFTNYDSYVAQLQRRHFGIILYSTPCLEDPNYSAIFKSMVTNVKASECDTFLNQYVAVFNNKRSVTNAEGHLMMRRPVAYRYFELT